MTSSSSHNQPRALLPLEQHAGAGFSIMDRVYPKWVTWFYPPWHERAKIVLSLLEFAMDSYQHANFGTFYLCNISHTTIGVGDKSDIKILDLRYIKTPEQLLHELAHIPCTKDADCTYTSQCVTRCDVTERACTGEIIRPTLSHICTYILTFIMHAAPKRVKGDLAHALDKCEKLSVYQSDMNLRYSVVHNDLKSLLWGQISYVVPV